MIFFDYHSVTDFHCNVAVIHFNQYRPSLNCKYIDLNILIERPIRGLGKFNLEKGKFPRTFDNYILDRWCYDSLNCHKI